MKLETPHNPGGTLLSADFAERVMVRADRVRHRRKLRRRFLGVAGACAIAFGAVFYLRLDRSADTQLTTSAETPISGDWDSSTIQETQVPESGTFSDTYPVVNSGDSEPGWHLYDSWWTSNS
jgi:hypothetical protein